MHQAVDHYLSARISTATPAQLTGMLYDAAVGALRAAVRLQEAGDWQRAIPKSIKAQNIILELRGCLDQDAGGRLAADLHQLYSWAHGRLLLANRERDVALTRQALAVVEPLASAWREGVLGVTAAAA